MKQTGADIKAGKKRNWRTKIQQRQKAKHTVAFLSSLLEPLMLPNLRRAEEMRHLCDEAVDEAPPSLLVRCIVPLIYRPLRQRRDARRGEARRIEGRGRIFSC